MNELLEALHNDETLTTMSNTKMFKMIPFQNHMMSEDQMSELISRQNTFLHDCEAILVINLGRICYRFKQSHKLIQENDDEEFVDLAEDPEVVVLSEEQESKDEETKKSEGDENETEDINIEEEVKTQIGEWEENEESIIQKLQEETDVWEEGENDKLFYSWETGCPHQVYFITSKTKKEQAERWIDNLFNYFLTTYGAKRCEIAFNTGEKGDYQDARQSNK